MYKKGFLISVILLTTSVYFPILTYAETIILKSGKTIEGKLIEKTDKYIKIDFYGVPLTYYIDEIKSIDGVDISFQSSIKTLPLKTSFQVIEESLQSIVAIDAIHPSWVSAGSGFVIKGTGIVVTNFHVIAGAEKINIILKNKKIYPAVSVIAYNPMKDFCILRIEASDLPMLSISDSDNIQSGQKVLAIGIPNEDLEHKVSEGVFLGIKEIRGIKYLQFSGSMEQGCSGGPVLDMDGKVIGINTIIDPRSKNLNFALPINEIKDYIETKTKITINEIAKNNISKAYLLFNEGKRAISRGDAATATQYYKQAIDIEPSFLEAHCKLGNSYVVTGMLDEAIIELEKTITMDSRYTAAYNDLAIAYARKGMFDKAVATVNKAINLNPKESSLYATLGFIYLANGMIDGAIAELKKSIDIDPMFGLTYIDLAYAYYNKGQYDLAIYCCNKAAELGIEVDAELLEKLKPYSQKLR